MVGVLFGGEDERGGAGNHLVVVVSDKHDRILTGTRVKDLDPFFAVHELTVEGRIYLENLFTTRSVIVVFRVVMTNFTENTKSL